MKKFFSTTLILLIPGILLCQSEMHFKKIIKSNQNTEEVKNGEGYIYVEENEVSLTVISPSINRTLELKLLQNIDNKVFVYESFKNNIEYLITINFKINTTQISRIRDGNVVEREIYPWSSLCLYIKN